MNIPQIASKKMIQIGLLFFLTLLIVLSASTSSGNDAMAAGPSSTTDYFNCTPTGVAAFIDRVHVRCSPAAPGNIMYFAYCSRSDSALASRFLSIFTTAKVTGKNLDIFYDPNDDSGTACGCSTSDCQVIWGAEVNP
jgi:hypothetical protein